MTAVSNANQARVELIRARESLKSAQDRVNELLERMSLLNQYLGDPQQQHKRIDPEREYTDLKNALVLANASLCAELQKMAAAMAKFEIA